MESIGMIGFRASPAQDTSGCLKPLSTKNFRRVRASSKECSGGNLSPTIALICSKSLHRRLV